MILLSTLSAVAGGLCGLIEGPQWWPGISPNIIPPEWEGHIPGSWAITKSYMRHLKSVRTQQKQWEHKLGTTDTTEKRLTARWARGEWNSGKLVPDTALECPVLFSYYLTEQEDGSITVCAPWDQFDSNAKSIA